MKTYNNLYDEIASLPNLFLAWEEFRKGKTSKKDILEFEWRLEENIIKLCRDLRYHRYKHGVYISFYITDPKRRQIHKATVRDRVLHHAIFRILNPIFEPCFISHSFSCQVGKGTHRGVKTLANILRKVSQNNTSPCFALKCDIKQFFGSVDHSILLNIIKKKIKDKETSWLLGEIIESFSPPSQIKQESKIYLRQESLFVPRYGLPIGNLTSQLFANIYLNEFDYYIKHDLKIKHYLRYTDDFIIVDTKKENLVKLLPKIRQYLSKCLRLELHPNKVEIRKYSQGIDFLGYVILPFHCRVRTKTKRRTFKKLKHKVEEYKAGLILKYTLEQSLHSYIGILKHANCYKLQNKLKNQFWFWLSG